jgi:hypothetical protein
VKVLHCPFVLEKITFCNHWFLIVDYLLEYCNSEDISLDGLEQELEEHKNYDVSLKPIYSNSPFLNNNDPNEMFLPLEWAVNNLLFKESV